MLATALKRSLVLVATATLAACAGSPSEPAGPAGLAIVGGQLIDGTGGDPIADSVIVVRDGRIAAAGPRESTEVPEGAEVVDAAGRTIIPGLVDMHAHYGGDEAAVERAFRAQLHYGVTTARSIGSDPPDRVALMLEANAGRPDAPRMFTAGRGFTHPEGFNAGIAQQPTSAEEARGMVRDLAGQGVHFVKMWVNETAEPDHKITPEIRTAIVEEAIANGLVPVAHIDDEADGRQLVEAGLRDFLHSTVLTFGPGSGAPVDDPEPSAEFIRMCLDNGVSFTPTLSIIQNNWHFAENPELLEDADLRAAMNPQALERWSDPEARAQVVEAAGFEDRKAQFRQVQDFVKTMHDAGVRIALGTDARHQQRADGLGRPPRAGAVRRGGADPDAGPRRRHRDRRQPDRAGRRGGVRHPRGRQGRRPRGPRRRPPRGHPEHPADRPGHEDRRVGGARRAAAGAVVCTVERRRFQGVASVSTDNHRCGSWRRPRPPPRPGRRP